MLQRTEEDRGIGYSRKLDRKYGVEISRNIFTCRWADVDKYKYKIIVKYIEKICI